MINYRFGVELDRITQENLPSLREWRNEWPVWKWCRHSDLIHPAGHDKWFQWQASDPSVSMYKIMTGSMMVGVCGLTSIDPVHRRAEFSLYIAPSSQRKGLGEAALKTLFMQGFRNLNLHLIWGETFNHDAAARLFRKIGMSEDGCRRDFYFRDGLYRNALLFSITAEEFCSEVKKNENRDRSASNGADVVPIDFRRRVDRSRDHESGSYEYKGPFWPGQ